MTSPHGHGAQSHRGHYARLTGMAALSFIAMYILMYAMVDRFDNVYSNFNQFYMAGLMTVPMVVLELVLMKSMYANRRVNGAIFAICAVAFVALWFGIREQGGISERQFLRSMIPHHAGAILMCEQTEMTDAAVLRLCRDIVSNQKSEIDQMKALLSE
jgi:hypothetical protein